MTGPQAPTVTIIPTLPAINQALAITLGPNTSTIAQTPTITFGPAPTAIAQPPDITISLNPIAIEPDPVKTTLPIMYSDASAPFDDHDADVILRSSDNVDFRVYKLLLSMGSPFFKDMFSLPQADTTAADGISETKDGLPVIQVSETAVTLRMLLSMCYPMGAVDLPALDKLEKVALLLDAAVKYSFERVEKRVREALVSPQCMHGNEVRVFAIACRHRMGAEAKAAARACLEQPILEVEEASELESLSAVRFLRLLKYHGKCVKLAREALANFSPQAGATLTNTYQLCSSCGTPRTFLPTEPTQLTPLPVLSQVLLLRLPSRAEIETAMEGGATSARMKCQYCGNAMNVPTKGSAGHTFKSLREVTDQYCSKLERAISSVFYLFHNGKFKILISWHRWRWILGFNACKTRSMSHMDSTSRNIYIDFLPIRCRSEAVSRATLGLPFSNM